MTPLDALTRLEYLSDYRRELDEFYKAANEAPREYEDAQVRRLPQEEK